MNLMTSGSAGMVVDIEFYNTDTLPPLLKKEGESQGVQFDDKKLIAVKTRAPFPPQYEFDMIGPRGAVDYMRQLAREDGVDLTDELLEEVFGED